jgi:hypothetical protein
VVMAFIRDRERAKSEGEYGQAKNRFHWKHRWEKSLSGAAGEVKGVLRSNRANEPLPLECGECSDSPANCL